MNKRWLFQAGIMLLILSPVSSTVNAVTADTVVTNNNSPATQKKATNFSSENNNINSRVKAALVSDPTATNNGLSSSRTLSASKMLPKVPSTSQQTASPSTGTLSTSTPLAKPTLDEDHPLENASFDFYGIPCSFDSATGTLTLSAGTMSISSSVAGLSAHISDASSVHKIVIAGPITAVGNMSNVFSELPNLTNIEGLDKVNTSQATAMAYMFSDDANLSTLNISHFDTSSVADMAYMFQGNASLSTLDLSHFDTSKVTNMTYMFQGDANLSTLDLSHFDTSSVTDMAYMFQGNASLSTLDLSHFDTSSVTDMAYMFQGDASLSTLDLSHFDTAKVTNMTYMFQGNIALPNLNVSHFDTSNVTNMAYMFDDTSLPTLDVSNWNTSKVIDMSSMFHNNPSLSTLDVSNWNTSKVTDMFVMFSSDTNLPTLDVSHWDTSNVNDVAFMFLNDTSLTTVDVSHWDTSKATRMIGMFQGDTGLTTLDVSNWNTSNVTDLNNMFNGDTNLSAVDVSHWDTAKVTRINSIFQDNTSLSTLDVSHWDTSNVGDFFMAFAGCTSLERLNLSGNFAIKTTSTTSMLEGTLPKVLILGSKVKLDSSMNLPTIPTTDGVHSGKWQNVGSGTEAAPKGANVWDSSELMSNYNGGTGQPDTYVWQLTQKVGKVTFHFVDEAGNPIPELSDQTYDPSTDGKHVGDTYDLTGKHSSYDTSVSELYTFDSASSNATGTYTASPMTITYKYKGKLSLTSIAQFTFGNNPTISMTPQSYPVTSMTTGQSLKVVDTLPNSSGWKLTGQLTAPLTGSTSHDVLNGSMFYSSDGTHDQDLATATTIATGTDKSKNISDDWTNGKGLKIKTKGVTRAEDYTGTITWTLSDVVPNN